MTEITRRGDTIILGNDEVRIEEGFARKTATATEELLHDDNTAPHYYEGTRPEPFVTPKGDTVTISKKGVDSIGNPIKLGEPMVYLDYGGKVAAPERCFYIFAKRPIDPTKEFFDDSTRNPHFVPEHVRAGALLADDGTPPNRTHYEYIFEVVDTRPTEEEAIARGEEILAAERE